MKTILTVPHVCTKTHKDPGCDKNVYDYGDKLKSFLPNSILVVSDTPRFWCDKNRKNCRNVFMRARLSPKLDKFRNNAVLLDIHSFPRYSTFALPNIKFVVMHAQTQSTIEAAYFLFTLLYRAGLPVTIKGAAENDIIREAGEKSIPAALLEIRDDISSENVVRLVGEPIKFWAQELKKALEKKKFV